MIKTLFAGVTISLGGLYSCHASIGPTPAYSSHGAVAFTKEADKVVKDAWRELFSLGAERTFRAFDELSDCLDENKDGVVTEREARSGTHVVMNPRKPIGKLWLPARLHHPIALYEQRESLEWFMEDNSRWKPLIRELIDLNGDGRHSYYEIRDAMYRMFPY